MFAPDTGPACRHHNTQMEWKDTSFAERPGSGPSRSRRPTCGRQGSGAAVSPARDNGGVVARPETGSIPDAPGSYQFLDAEGRVIYVGKAKSLRSRLSNYFLQPELLAERTRQMVTTAESVEWIVAKNEVEAFFLEFNLIKRHKPRFNIRLKDDKSYPYLAVTLDEDWPRAMVLRGQKRKGVRYFGPYARVRHPRDARPPLAHLPDPHVHQGEVRPASSPRPPVPLRAHREMRGAVRRRHQPRRLRQARPRPARLPRRRARRGSSSGSKQRMAEASDQLEFELAARCATSSRASARRSNASRWWPRAKKTSTSSVSTKTSLEASVQVFYVRKGRVVGRKGLIVDKVEDVETPALVARIVEQLYADAAKEDVPREILVPVEPDDRELYEEFLTLNRGAKVRVRVPQRGGKRDLLQTATLNARESFQRHKLRRASDHNARARALVSLQEELGLPEAPLRIECFDISNLQGTEIVGSMVVMEDGMPKRSDYRRFKVRGLDGQDDFASMEDVLTRRFRNYLRERDEGAHTGKRFSYPPNLLLIDGGKGQLNVAVRVLEELGLEDICVASLAKRFEEVYLPGRSDPVRIPATPRRCISCSRSATRPTGSRSPTTASCATRR